MQHVPNSAKSKLHSMDYLKYVTYNPNGKVRTDFRVSDKRERKREREREKLQPHFWLRFLLPNYPLSKLLIDFSAYRYSSPSLYRCRHLK